MVVNAWGDLDDGTDPPWPELAPTDAEQAFQNTTIGLIVTNARLDKVGCLLVAQGGHDGLARSLVPSHGRLPTATRWWPRPRGLIEADHRSRPVPRHARSWSGPSLAFVSKQSAVASPRAHARRDRCRGGLLHEMPARGGAHAGRVGDGRPECRPHVRRRRPGRRGGPPGSAVRGEERASSSIGSSRRRWASRAIDVYIANVVKCRPPENRDPKPDEIAACRPYLEAQLDLIGPKVIVTLGHFAGQLLLETSDGITKLRGRAIRSGMACSSRPCIRRQHCAAEASRSPRCAPTS